MQSSQLFDLWKPILLLSSSTPDLAWHSLLVVESASALGHQIDLTDLVN